MTGYARVASRGSIQSVKHTPTGCPLRFSGMSSAILLKVMSNVEDHLCAKAHLEKNTRER